MKSIVSITTVFRFALAGCLLALLVVAGGCTTARAPELNSTSMTKGQEANQISRVESNNLRGIWDDTSRIFFFNRNSRLSPYVMP